MSDYEKLNAGVKANVVNRRKSAFGKVAILVMWLAIAIGAFLGLEAISFISNLFMVILISISVCVCAFKIGYVWHDIKF